MTKTLACKFCSTPTTVIMDDAAFEMFSINVWLSMAACNRCADYRMRRRAMLDEIDKATRSLQSHKIRGSVTADVIYKARPWIERVAKKFTFNANDYYGTQATVDPFLIESLIEDPEKSIVLLMQFEKSIKTQPRQQSFQAVHNDP